MNQAVYSMWEHISSRDIFCVLTYLKWFCSEPIFDGDAVEVLVYKPIILVTFWLYDFFCKTEISCWVQSKNSLYSTTLQVENKEYLVEASSRYYRSLVLQFHRLLCHMVHFILTLNEEAFFASLIEDVFQTDPLSDFTNFYSISHPTRAKACSLFKRF